MPIKKKILILATEPLQDMVIGRNGTLTIAMSFAQKNYEIFFANEVEIGSGINEIEAQQVHFKNEIYSLHRDYEIAIRKYSAKITEILRQKKSSSEPLKPEGLKISDKKNSLKISPSQKIPYVDFSIIINRFDPIDDVNWTKNQIEKLRIISIKHHVPVIGKPNNVDKYESLALPDDLHPQTFFISAEASLKNLESAEKILKNHNEIIVKPAKSGQGKGVKKAATISEVKAAINEINQEFSNNLSDGLILQEMLPGALRGDVRTIFYRDKNGKFQLGGHLARSQLKKGFINCISSGQAVAVEIKEILSSQEITNLKKNSAIILKHLNQHQLSIDSHLIGVDFIPRFLEPAQNLPEKTSNAILVLEINFLCVALFNMIDYLANKSPFAKNSLTEKIIEGMRHARC